MAKTLLEWMRRKDRKMGTPARAQLTWIASNHTEIYVMP